MRRVHVTIAGKVQGVFFRASLDDEAQRRQVTGWVRNTPDGQVEAELQGPDLAVEEVLAFCREGPPAASVEHVETAELDPDPRLTGFTVQ
ncbi:acylphosphatase [Egibacter rhizosphaerae]|uniref:Acylphosphatase n=1 Tax=Egibacter rhizosphaerae TaxID=1670831 RepID=A0A411YG96_9ACTN|nr:acylphosphatase [Egibacter rhizosphaerae]QBI20177.1 acylphosphatase [Egibacter rhizosphaerae]